MPNSKNITHSRDAVAAYVKLIRAAETLHSEVSRGLAVEGLTASQFSTLKVLKLRGSIPQKDIASYLLKTGGNVTVVVDNLEREGLVKRTRDTVDRRLVLVSISPDGERLFDRLYPSHLKRIKTAMKHLDSDEIDRFCTLLETLLPAVQEPVCSPIVSTASEEVA